MIDPKIRKLKTKTTCHPAPPPDSQKSTYISRRWVFPLPSKQQTSTFDPKGGSIAKRQPGTYAGKNSEDTAPPLLLRAHGYLLLLPTLHPVRARAFLTLEFSGQITGSESGTFAPWLWVAIGRQLKGGQRVKLDSYSATKDA